MINERKLSDEVDGKKDLLSNLINANEELLEDGGQGIGEVELIGTVQYSVCWPISSHVPFRKHFHVLHCWTRGGGPPTNVDHRLTSTA